MSLRSCFLVLGLVVPLLLAVCGGQSSAQQAAQNQGPVTSPPMSSADEANQPAPSKEYLISQLDLKLFVAALGDLTLCADDELCQKHAKRIRTWLCAAVACDGADKTKKPLDCFEGISDQFKNSQDQMNALICPLLKTPNADTRKAFLSRLPDGDENDLVEKVAYVLALQGSASACENYIKDYVGPYGPQWKYRWYRAMSGCRMLSGDSTKELEEKNYTTWFGVVQGTGSCSDIYITEMRSACSAPGATSPVLVDYAQ